MAKSPTVETVVTTEAQATVVVVEAQAAKISAETKINTQQRIESGSTTGQKLGRPRIFTEDKNSLNSQIDIKSTQTSILEIAKEASSQSPSGSAISHKQIVSELKDLTVVVKKDRPDLERSLQRNQRTCNHLYDKSSKRCLYCSKRRDSHVYDPINKSVIKT